MRKKSIGRTGPVQHVAAKISHDVSPNGRRGRRYRQVIFIRTAGIFEGVCSLERSGDPAADWQQRLHIPFAKVRTKDGFVFVPLQAIGSSSLLPTASNIGKTIILITEKLRIAPLLIARIHRDTRGKTIFIDAPKDAPKGTACKTPSYPGNVIRFVNKREQHKMAAIFIASSDGRFLYQAWANSGALKRTDADMRRLCRKALSESKIWSKPSNAFTAGVCWLEVEYGTFVSEN